MAPAANSSALSDTEYEMVKHIINIEELENSWSDCSIYSVPCYLRKVNEVAYTPQLISIGPIHHGREELKPMEEQKRKYFHFFQRRLSIAALQGYKHYLETEEEKIRSCYAQKFPHIKKDKFVELIMLDAFFIMEHILRISSWKSQYKSRNKEDNMDSESFRSRHRDDYVLTQSWLSKSIHRDLLLLENQLPMFVLMALYKIVSSDDSKKTDKHDKSSSFLYPAFQYFAIYDKSSSDETKPNLQERQHFTDLEDQKSLDKLDQKIKKLGEPKHFTDLIRYFYLPTNLEEYKHSPSSVLRTVTKLQEAGVSFERVLESCLLEVRFHRDQFLSLFLCLGCIPHMKSFKASVLIPQLKVDHTTECVLRNLIAFEQCHYPLEPYVCNYVSLLDSLIHTKDDVELLVEKEVIVHELGSDKEVATLVNGLCKHVVAHTTCYGKVIHDIDNHYQNPWYHYMAALRLVYFRDPWRASSTLVGIAVLVFTIFNFCRVIRVVF